MNTFEEEETLETLKVIISGFLMALVLNAYSFTKYFNKEWSWVNWLPVKLLASCMAYMETFFHELGHTVIYWFYGYITLPSFDFQHGGGMTYPVTGSLLILHLALYAFLARMIWHWQGRIKLQITFGAIILFHLLTVHNDAHTVIAIFGGPLIPLFIAAFLLIRAWFDLAPRGIVERFLNAAFGFGLALSAISHGWSLLHDNVVRQVYFKQKDGHGFGDFDLMADISDINFSTLIWVWLIFAVAAMIIPAILYLKRDDVYAFLDANKTE